jgi:CubicO group peptidase (beta-lactamase class C family)
MRQKIQELLEQSIADQIFPGASVALITGGSASLIAGASSQKDSHIEFIYCGNQEYDHNSPSISQTSIYDCASLTKVIPNSLIALRLLDRGLFDLDEPIFGLCPELKMSHKEQITWRHLLNHTLDYRISLSQLKDLSIAEIEEKLFSFEFEKPPGTSYLYCNATSWLLGKCLEKLTKTSLENLAQQEVFEPLNLSESTFRPLEKFELSRIVPTENCPWRAQKLRGIVHDESSFTLTQNQNFVGSAGLFSSLKDVAQVAQMFLNLANSDEYLSPKVKSQFFEMNMLNNMCLGLGLERQNTRFMGQNASTFCFGKTGFTGCCFVVDSQKQKGFVLLSNFTWPTREKTPERIFELRSQIADLVFGA